MRNLIDYDILDSYKVGDTVVFHMPGDYYPEGSDMTTGQIKRMYVEKTSKREERRAVIRPKLHNVLPFQPPVFYDVPLDNIVSRR